MCACGGDGAERKCQSALKRASAGPHYVLRAVWVAQNRKLSGTQTDPAGRRGSQGVVAAMVTSAASVCHDCPTA